ncbi:MAG: hypothetical protein V3V56_05305 [bacterium]
MRRQPSRTGQNWIFDNFLKLSDNEGILHPGVLGGRYERGFKHVDLENVYKRVTGRRSFPRAWARQTSEGGGEKSNSPGLTSASYPRPELGSKAAEPRRAQPSEGRNKKRTPGAGGNETLSPGVPPPFRASPPGDSFL